MGSSTTAARAKTSSNSKTAKRQQRLQTIPLTAKVVVGRQERSNGVGSSRHSTVRILGEHRTLASPHFRIQIVGSDQQVLAGPHIAAPGWGNFPMLAVVLPSQCHADGPKILSPCISASPSTEIVLLLLPPKCAFWIHGVGETCWVGRNRGFGVLGALSRFGIRTGIAAREPSSQSNS